MFADLINLSKIRRALLYAFCFGVALWLQFSVFSRAGLPSPGTGGTVKPFFIPVVVVALGLWEGGVWGGVYGLLAGLYCDMNLAGSTVLFLILLAAVGFFSGVLADFLINRRFVAYLLLSAAALLLTALSQTVGPLLFRGAPVEALLPVALYQTLWSLPFSVPAYFAVRAIAHSDLEPD